VTALDRAINIQTAEKETDTIEIRTIIITRQSPSTATTNTANIHRAMAIDMLTDRGDEISIMENYFRNSFLLPFNKVFNKTRNFLGMIIIEKKKD
jgi:hypothetical protein